jgi:hypothetical protein
MQSSYNSLSGFLNNQIDNHNINEGLLTDGIKKIIGFASGIEPSKEQTTKAKGLLGLFGALKASLSDDDDEITKAYKETMQKEQEQLDQQHRDIQEKISKLEAEKIRAKSELKRNQRALKHKEHKDAYDARIAQVKAYAARAKNVKVILSANETDSMLRTIDAVGKELQIGADSPVKKMTELAMQICVGPDGKCRSLDEIKELAKTDTALAEHLKEYDSIAKEHGKVMVSSMKDQKAFSAAFDKFQKAADEERAAEALEQFFKETL